jgi:hypothetical protein
MLEMISQKPFTCSFARVGVHACVRVANCFLWRESQSRSFVEPLAAVEAASPRSGNGGTLPGRRKEREQNNCVKDDAKWRGRSDDLQARENLLVQVYVERDINPRIDEAAK